MKLALLLPGYLDSPDYLHMVIFEKMLHGLDYTVKRLDPCNLWETGDTSNYNVTNYLKSIRGTIDSYKSQNIEELVLIGHSLGGFVAIVAGARFTEVTKIVALCPPFSVGMSNGNLDESGARHSKRELPFDKSKFREFVVSKSFIEDRSKYSTIDEVKNLNKPLMILIALDDKQVSPEDTEQLIKVVKNPYVVRLENLEHNFRHSEIETNRVAIEIEKFLMQ